MSCRADRPPLPGGLSRRFAGSMVARVFALLLAGLVLAAALAGTLAWWRLGETGQIGMPEPRAWATRVAAFVKTLEGAAPGDRDQVWILARAGGIGPVSTSEHALADRPDGPLAEALAQALQRGAQVAEPADWRACSERGTGSFSPGQWHCRLVRTSLRDGSPLELRVEESTSTWVWSTQTARGLRHGPILLALLLALLILAAAITRVALAPMLALVRGAERFGDDVNAPPLAERGPREIRTAVAVFNRMQARIRAHLTERTTMLAAIAHDLQTPLTRLRLRLEQVDDPALRQRLSGDLEECQARVREGLELARSLDDHSPLVDVELDALLASACSEAQDAGWPVQLMGSSGLTVRARPQALLRCVENLVSNAVKYGQRAEVRAQRDGDWATVRVRDHGPGLPAADLERVFEPFVRLEDSRSRDSGGTGLGLTIVRNLIRGQRGEVSLRSLAPPEGPGLEASLRIPLAAIRPA